MKKYQIFLKYTNINIKSAVETLIMQSCNLLLIDKEQIKIEKLNSDNYSVIVNTANSAFIIDITGDLRVDEIITIPQ